MPYTISEELQKDLVEFLGTGRSSPGNRLLGRLVQECEGQEERPGPKRYPAVEINGEWFEYTSTEYEHFSHAQMLQVLVPTAHTQEVSRAWVVNSSLSTVTIKPSRTANPYRFYGAKVIGLDVHPGSEMSLIILRFDADQPYRGSI